MEGTVDVSQPVSQSNLKTLPPSVQRLHAASRQIATSHTQAPACPAALYCVSLHGCASKLCTLSLHFYLQNGKKDGLGTYWWPTGASYKGEWANGSMQGVGTFESPDGTRYQGGWAQDLKQGLGKKWFPNGDTYEVCKSLCCSRSSIGKQNAPHLPGCAVTSSYLWQNTRDC